MTSEVSRRRFLGGSAAAAVGTVLTTTTVMSSCSEDTLASPDERHYLAFEGVHQQGVVTPAPQQAIVIAFDSVARDRPALEQMFRTLTAEVRSLMAGEAAPDGDPLLPPVDNMIAGPQPAADDLTITVAVGASLFDERYGLGSLKPRELKPMPVFPNDKPDVAQMHGDIVLQICAGTPESCNHALRRLMRATRDSLVLKWMTPGFITRNTLPLGRASQRNLLGFKDGTANPHADDSSLMDELVWAAADEPAWAANGSYMVVRLIRNRVEFWDRTSLRTQETIIGREKASGAPLGSKNETDVPDFASDPSGTKFRLDGHIRLANPRTPQTEKSRILRRGYNYSAGFDRAGQLDQGLLFICFQRSLNDGFVAVQTRLNGEALEEYITPFGGGFFYVLPGVQGDGHLAQTLLEA